MTREPISILLVEDSDTDANIVSAQLRYSEHADCTLTWVTSILNATAAIKAAAPDVVLMDLGLPDATGIDAVVAITSKFPELPVVVLTGHDDFYSGLLAIQAGAQEYILKDEISVDILERAIFHARERKRISRKQAKFYRDSVRSLVPEAADAMELQRQCQLMKTTLEHVRERVKNRSPSMVAEIDAVIRENSIPDESTFESTIGTPVETIAKTVVERYSAVPEAVSTVTSSDPRSVLSDVLSRYAPKVEPKGLMYGPR